MAIKVNGTTVIDDSRNISNVGTVTATSFSGDGSALTGIDSGGATLLGTLNTTSGQSVTLSGLNLTGYKFVYFVFDAVRVTANTYVYIDAISYSTQIALFIDSDGLQYFDGTIDLGAGVVTTSVVKRFNVSTGDYSGRDDNRAGGNPSPYSTASTFIRFTLESGKTFQGGSIRFYGVA